MYQITKLLFFVKFIKLEIFDVPTRIILIIEDFMFRIYSIRFHYLITAIFENIVLHKLKKQ